MLTIIAVVDFCHVFITVKNEFLFINNIQMFGELNEDEIDELIKEQVLGRLGCSVDNFTYVVPVSFAYDGQYIYGHTSEGMKIDMMRENPNVCFEVDALTNMANWRSAVCWGVYEELTNADDRENALKILLDRPLPFITSKTVQIGASWPFHPSSYKNITGIVYRILITKKTGRFEKEDTPWYYAS